MDNVYQETIRALIAQAYPELVATHRLEFKNVFGAVGGYVNDRIFASCGKFGFALRLPPEMLLALFREKEAWHLKYFPNGHVKKEYAVLHKRILEDKDRLRMLLKKSVQYTLLS
ncbi:MAG: TfoX/Sxy family protein [Ignavibacteriales bacterium]|nr:TfoX/Sxy family protein [Ignavibacteriales bacterium]